MLSHKMARIQFLLALLICTQIWAPGLAGTAETTLAWDPNSEADLAGYRLHVLEQPHGSAYRPLATIPLADIDPQTPRYTVVDLMPDAEYWFVVTAYNLSGEESGPSNSVCVINGDSCTPRFATSSGGGCFLSNTNTPSALRTRDPIR
ncbi:MAG: fibronectin type III domain-containing protein [Desulfosarcinaceae bacterium]|nr:fibronectin type III domain-containing protein [Desulfosarcinaceae bacterium]